MFLAGSMHRWRADKLRRFQELHFTYEEEASPEDFFVPYVWTQVLSTVLTLALNLHICNPLDPKAPA